MPLIRPRSEWGSTYDYAARHRTRPAPSRKQDVRLHHSVTIAPDLDASTVSARQDEYRAMRTLEQIGVSRFGSGVSYNVAVMPSGQAYWGQPLTNKATHSDYGDHNYTRASIVLVGNYEVSRPTARQLLKVARILVRWRKQRVIPDFSVLPHSATKATSCPGRYAREKIPAIQRRARLLTVITPAPDPIPVPEPQPEPILEEEPDVPYQLYRVKGKPAIFAVDLSGARHIKNPTHLFFLRAEGRVSKDVQEITQAELDALLEAE
jgi:hypothetical protein